MTARADAVLHEIAALLAKPDVALGDATFDVYAAVDAVEAIGEILAAYFQEEGRSNDPPAIPLPHVHGWVEQRLLADLAARGPLAQAILTLIADDFKANGRVRQAVLRER